MTLDLTSLTSNDKDALTEHIISELRRYSHENMSKFIGVGVPALLTKTSPSLCSRLWLDLDAVPITIQPEVEFDGAGNESWDKKCVDEQADSMARKCIM